jgi:hypothetical protein
MTNLKDTLSLNDKSLKKYAKLIETILIIENELKKNNNLDNYKNSRFVFKKFVILKKEIEIIEAENKKNYNKIIDQLIREAKKAISEYNYVIFLNCSQNLNFLDTLFTGRICGWEILFKDIQINDLFFGKGYFADQIYLKSVEKTSSNSWINIFFNSGIVSLFVCATFIVFIFCRFFNFKNINHENFYLSISHYFFLYFIARSIFEDTIAFVSIDFLMFSTCLLLISESKKKIH